MRDKVTTKPAQHIFVALDTSDLMHALKLAQMLKGRIGGVKIGKEFFTSHGPTGTRMIADEGLPIFLDLKFHDIPNTVAGAVRASISLKPFILNVHAAGGRAMMESARDAAAEEANSQGVDRPLILGVTVLTSLDEADLKEIGLSSSTNDQVRRLASLAQESGL
ncbi:MAG TPA: orotidine-5'-phosphate decarboxylase, partial [Rhodospirillales bacterium]|nr:orotidine-5'-phosphate decarboxylase [Rhodospirillales bacterium]